MEEKTVNQFTGVNEAGIPQELKDEPQWICWRPGPPRENGKIPKIPVNPNTGGNALTNIPSTWGNFEQALKHCQGNNECRGIGFVFDPIDPYVGIDLDNCRDPKTGEIKKWAQDIVDQLASYTEISVSGSGLHIIVKGVLPNGR
jgi:putative DNA primase/helicase